MKKIIAILLLVVFTAVASGCTQLHSQGTGMGAALGGITGAILDKKNPWRGGVIGAAIGGAAGASAAELSQRAAQEAVAASRPVQYRTADDSMVYRADPAGHNARTDCNKVQERVWKDGSLIRDEIREVCDGNRRTNSY
ncbi:MAG: glycine zipper 2TM domain-containing protein [Nitrospira sp.]|nr:glycine zipper 2TM domain-containing protein [bacterium]MBL7050376.1 glycine zipper 2TM domain-containing protein [Nitrospira sp.]